MSEGVQRQIKAWNAGGIGRVNCKIAKKWVHKRLDLIPMFLIKENFKAKDL